MFFEPIETRTMEATNPKKEIRTIRGKAALTDVAELLGYSGTAGIQHYVDEDKIDKRFQHNVAEPEVLIDAVEESPRRSRDVLRRLQGIKKEETVPTKTNRQAQSELQKASSTLVRAFQSIFDNLDFPPRVLHENSVFWFGGKELFLGVGKDPSRWQGMKSFKHVPEEYIRKLNQGVYQKYTHPETPQSPIFLNERGARRYIDGVRGCPKAEEYSKALDDLVVEARREHVRQKRPEKQIDEGAVADRILREITSEIDIEAVADLIANRLCGKVQIDSRNLPGWKLNPKELRAKLNETMPDNKEAWTELYDTAERWFGLHVRTKQKNFPVGRRKYRTIDAAEDMQWRSSEPNALQQLLHCAQSLYG